MKAKPINRYEAVISAIFQDHFRPGMDRFEFTRDAFVAKASALGIAAIKNLGDIIYSFKFRRPLPADILATQPDGLVWSIRNVGIAKYQFRLGKASRVHPNTQLITIKLPDATPEIITAYALGDEQALLARVRYNRLIDIFLGITSYSLQNHLRTTVKQMGQIEIDEIYVGIDKHGRQYVVPVQAKGGDDHHGPAQTEQDIACCAEKFPGLICRPVAAQFMQDGRIAMFELTLEGDELRIVEEKHYQLVPAQAITAQDLGLYRQRGP